MEMSESEILDNLKKLKLGDELWLPDKFPLFKPVGFFQDKYLVASCIGWPDGEVTYKPLIEGKGPEYYSAMQYEFAGCFKSDESWQRVFFFKPWGSGGSNWQVRWYISEGYGDLTGKNNVQAAKLKWLLPSETQLKASEIFFDKKSCEAWCSRKNRASIDFDELTKGLRKMQKTAKDFKKSLEQKDE